MMNLLAALMQKHGTNKARHGYAPLYEMVLDPLRTTPGRLLEVGVHKGASLRTWQEYLAPGSTIVGLDHKDPIEVEGCFVLQADQTDRRAVESIAKMFGPFDVIIDDGGHRTSQQTETLSLLWPHVVPGGWYVIEDLHTSTMPQYVDSKSMVDWLVEAMREEAARTAPIAGAGRAYLWCGSACAIRKVLF